MDILFWSGGKDAYLAMEFYRSDFPERPLLLLTTYNEKNGVVPHQNIPIETIKQQARSLNLKLLTVALPKDCPNDEYLEKVNKVIKQQEERPDYLLFGDWHLQDIRDWKEENFKELGYECKFPIWGKSLHELLPVLLLKPVEVKISTVRDEFQSYIKIGEPYNQHFVEELPEEIDPMGEHGEFHTKISIE